MKNKEKKKLRKKRKKRELKIQSFQCYASNDRRFTGTVQIPLDKVSNFMDAVKADKITVEKWEARICQK